MAEQPLASQERIFPMELDEDEKQNMTFYYI
jgi:hypothetical protein